MLWTSLRQNRGKCDRSSADVLVAFGKLPPSRTLAEAHSNTCRSSYEHLPKTCQSLVEVVYNLSMTCLGQGSSLCERFAEQYVLGCLNV